MIRGKVVFFNGNFGFLRPDDSPITEKDIFVHHSQVPGPNPHRKELKAGTVLEFEIKEQQNGRRQAVNVRLVPVAEPALSPAVSGEALRGEA